LLAMRASRHASEDFALSGMPRLLDISKQADGEILAAEPIAARDVCVSRPCTGAARGTSGPDGGEGDDSDSVQDAMAESSQIAPPARPSAGDEQRSDADRPAHIQASAVAANGVEKKTLPWNSWLEAPDLACVASVSRQSATAAAEVLQACVASMLSSGPLNAEEANMCDAYFDYFDKICYEDSGDEVK